MCSQAVPKNLQRVDCVLTTKTTASTFAVDQGTCIFTTTRRFSRVNPPLFRTNVFSRTLSNTCTFCQNLTGVVTVGNGDSHETAMTLYGQSVALDVRYIQAHILRQLIFKLLCLVSTTVSLSIYDTLHII